MRLALTIVSPAARRQADVLLEADPATPVGEVAAQLDRLLQAGPVPAAPPPGVLAFPGPRRAAGEPARVSLFVDQALVPQAPPEPPPPPCSVGQAHDAREARHTQRVFSQGRAVRRQQHAGEVVGIAHRG